MPTRLIHFLHENDKQAGTTAEIQYIHEMLFQYPNQNASSGARAPVDV